MIEPTCQALDVPFFSCRGYTSQSEMWAAAQRILGYILDGKEVVILHLGDHDPSGIDMTRDIKDRLRMFIRLDYLRAKNDEWDSIEDDAEQNKKVGELMRAADAALTVERLALNMDQIDQYGPPPNPAKVTDSRAREYIRATTARVVGARRAGADRARRPDPRRHRGAHGRGPVR